MSAYTDEELAAAAQRGSEEAVTELLERYKNAVRSVARSFFLEGGETEDLVQEGMIGLYAAIRSYRSDGGMRFRNYAWLCIRRRIGDAVRAASRKKHIPLNTYVSLDTEEGTEDDPESLLITGEEGRELSERIREKLSPSERRALKLYADGLRADEIAEREGKNVKSVENAIHRAKKKVRRILEERTEDKGQEG